VAGRGAISFSDCTRLPAALALAFQNSTAADFERCQVQPLLR
jgi:hypothetical protein